MKAIGYSVTVVGFYEFLLGASVYAGDCWILPPVLFLTGILTMVSGVMVIHKAERRERKRKRHARFARHFHDEDKLRMTDDMKALHQELIIKEIQK